MEPMRHFCPECNSLYEEPADGQDSSQDKDFASLPNDWKCACGAEKQSYKPCYCVADREKEPAAVQSADTKRAERIEEFRLSHLPSNICQKPTSVDAVHRFGKNPGSH